MNEFLNMGGYAFYVWMSYGITLVVLVWNIVQPLWYQKALFRRISNKLRRTERQI